MNKQKLWDKEAKWVEKIADGLGKPIEKGIKEAVIALNLLGFKTACSCEGHIERARPYPWVIIDVPRSKKKKAVHRNMNALLDEFYSDPNFSRDDDVVIEMFPHGIFGDFRLQGHGSKILDELPKELLTRRIRAKILKRYRAEMNLFSTFLKERFFKS